MTTPAPWHRISWRVIGLSLVLGAVPANAQLTDMTQTPNLANSGIKKSLTAQIGAGRGNLSTPDSSRFVIARDPFRAIRRGRQLFQRKFTAAQGLGPRTDDGVGNIEADASHGAGLSDSCASCHGRPRGAAGFGGDVYTRPDSRDAPHLFGLGLQEMLADEMTRDLRQIRTNAITQAQSSGAAVTRPLQTKGITFGQIVALPDGTVQTGGVQGVDPDLRVRPFFAQGGSFSIRDFVVGALKNEMGLQAPDPDLLAAANGGAVVTPSGMILDGSKDTFDAPVATSPTADPDQDGVVNEIDPALVDYFEFYLLNYFKPGIGEQNTDTEKGEELLRTVGCTTCHKNEMLLQQDRRVADVETVFDPVHGVFNRLYATATGRFTTIPDNSGFPAQRVPALQPFLVRRIFTDFKRHDLGPGFHERKFDGTMATQFMTEPLWGVASSPPYGHDGRSMDLQEVIRRHGGEAQAARDAFVGLPAVKQRQIIAFLNSLVLFPPDDTASNLDAGNPFATGYPQFGHGSIKLTALFNDPLDAE